MRYVGLDVHQNRSSLCILNGDGKRVKELEVRGGWDKLLEMLKDIAKDGPFAICYEASCGYGALYERISKLATRVTVAHPGKLRLIFKSKRKNDRVDARKLAMLLLMDQVPAVHVPSLDVRSWRAMIEHPDPGRRKIALVATAHWLLRVMLSMLRSGEVCRFEAKALKAAA
jgi:transposase